MAHSFATGAGGSWSVTIPVPNESHLLDSGATALWILFVGTSIEATNGVLLRFDRR